ncbi:hypothetical protein BC351_33820 [Paenibacillus ferrarius]|uniref:Uncharacterized protein n=1 Tax=Paenibacillus ferrarius TaxID=1469647 RepID=A0A1V4HDL4_9BACL|nr:hypothetical protein BC351_33820 [Paenibacillus ferrarius]
MTLVILFIIGITIASVKYGRYGASRMVVFVEIIFAIGMPVCLFYLYKIWFPSYYGGFITGLGALFVASMMIFVNIICIYPLTNYLRSKLQNKRMTCYIYFPLMLLSGLSQYMWLVWLN